MADLNVLTLLNKSSTQWLNKTYKNKNNVVLYLVVVSEDWVKRPIVYFDPANHWKTDLTCSVSDVCFSACVPWFRDLRVIYLVSTFNNNGRVWENKTWVWISNPKINILIACTNVLKHVYILLSITQNSFYPNVCFLFCCSSKLNL